MATRSLDKSFMSSLQPQAQSALGALTGVLGAEDILALVERGSEKVYCLSFLLYASCTFLF